jgi:predicted lipoprotein with Yx(FWY)xxD motif
LRKIRRDALTNSKLELECRRDERRILCLAPFTTELGKALHSLAQEEAKGVKFGYAIAAVTAVLLSGTTAWAQPADLPIPAATTTQYPPGVSVGSAGGIPVYVDAQGRTLYGMDMRTLLRTDPDTSQHCRGACAEVWEPLLAPADAKPNIRFPIGFGQRRPQGGAAGGAARAGGGEGLSQNAVAQAFAEMQQNQKAADWTIIQGPQGPQWVYKGWHMVFVRKGDKPGSAAYEGAEDKVWNTLKYVPPVPKVTAPVNVSTAFVDGGYALVDKDGRLLFTGSCGTDCSGWRPFNGALASSGVGEWTVSHETDDPQWLYRGKPVFVAQGGDSADMPAGATVLRP